MQKEVNKSEKIIKNLIIEYLEMLDCNEYVYVCNMMKNEVTRNLIIKDIESKLLTNKELDIVLIVNQIEMQIDFY